MAERFIFTVATGRCGQASLTEQINRDVPKAYAAFEEPVVRPLLPGVLGDAERHLRRSFIETDELLGRGRVLRAFVKRDDAYIVSIADRRLRQIRRLLARQQKSIYVDVSKFFARGLHLGYMKVLPSFSLILLVRDPLKNMRSFLNRDKNFFKDNVSPDADRNHLRLPAEALSKGEFYLWAWCEMYLRYLDLRDRKEVTHAVEIRTDDLLDSARMAEHFAALDLEFGALGAVPTLNTNAARGIQETEVTADDVRIFERFMGRLPAGVLARIDYLKNYTPRAAV